MRASSRKKTLLEEDAEVRVRHGTQCLLRSPVSGGSEHDVVSSSQTHNLCDLSPVEKTNAETKEHKILKFCFKAHPRLNEKTTFAGGPHTLWTASIRLHTVRSLPSQRTSTVAKENLKELTKKKKKKKNCICSRLGFRPEHSRPALSTSAKTWELENARLRLSGTAVHTGVFENLFSVLFHTTKCQRLISLLSRLSIISR